MQDNYIQTITGLAIAVVGYILRVSIDKIRTLEKQVNDSRMEIEIIKQNHNNLNDKFEQLYELIKEISKEVKDISISLINKKDRE